MVNYREERPWGSFENILDNDNCKVKIIIIKSGKRPSYQYHKQRAEYWVIIEGIAHVTLDDVEQDYNIGQIVFVPTGTAHRVENRGLTDLKFIEIQTGTYFGEDDIVRLEDDFGRIDV